MLVFWKVSDSWRIPDFSQMKGLYEKYGGNDGFAIITISLDDAERTRKFVEDNELLWLNCSPDSTTAAKFYKDYSLESLPVTFVIGREGEILARNPGSLELETILDNSLSR